MPERRIGIVLSEADVQEVERAVIDRDADCALEFLLRVIKPRIDAASRGGCRPVFELGGASRERVEFPPSGGNERSGTSAD